MEGCDTREVLWRDKAMAASTSRRHLRRPASCPLTSPAPGPLRGDHVLPGRPLQAVQLTEEQGPEAEETSRSGWSGSKCKSDSQSCFREREDRVRPFLYKSLPAELIPLAVRAVTEEHILLRETEALGRQEVRGMG